MLSRHIWPRAALILGLAATAAWTTLLGYELARLVAAAL